MIRNHFPHCKVKVATLLTNHFISKYQINLNLKKTKEMPYMTIIRIDALNNLTYISYRFLIVSVTGMAKRNF